MTRPDDSSDRLPEAVRQRNRAVAEREASRLARPEPRRVGRLVPASRKKSAVTSTPSGYHASIRADDTQEEEWCGPFSVARQMIKAWYGAGADVDLVGEESWR
jgi:hypothetical protein